MGRSSVEATKARLMRIARAEGRLLCRVLEVFVVCVPDFPAARFAGVGLFAVDVDFALVLLRGLVDVDFGWLPVESVLCAAIGATVSNALSRLARSRAGSDTQYVDTSLIVSM
jgi:hypothetical protein